MAVKIGDKLAEEKKYQEAIDVYRTVKSRQELLDAQNARGSLLSTAKMDANLKAAAGNPQMTLSAGADQLNELRGRPGPGGEEQLLGDFTKNCRSSPSSLLLRVA